LSLNVAAVLARAGDLAANPQQKQDLAAFSDLCGRGPATAYARRHFQMAAGERCGDHLVAAYVSNVNMMKRLLLQLAAGNMSNRALASMSACSSNRRRLSFSAVNAASCGERGLDATDAGLWLDSSTSNRDAFGTVFSAPTPTIACNSAIIWPSLSGLPKNRLSAGLSAVGWIHLAGNENDLDTRPAVVNGVGQLQAVHAARHLNVGKEQRYVGARFEYGECLIGIDGLHRREPGIFHNVNRTHTQHHLVLDDKDFRYFR
jgi:hypothetical protein